MAKLGIYTGSAPNDGTGDSLIDGAIKINSNFDEIYSTIGDGSALAVPVTSIAAGSNINVSGATGNVTITGLANTANVATDSLVVSGISTLGVVVASSLISTEVNVTGIVTALSFSGSGANITNISADTLVVSGIVTARLFAGYDYLQAPFGTTVESVVTVAAKTAAHRYNGTGSGNGYVIDGVESPFLTLTPGRTYRFTLSSGDMASHPFRFYLEADKTTAYTTNVTSTSTYTEIVVTDSTPQVLHYQCSTHAYMGNAVNTNSNVATGNPLQSRTIVTGLTTSIVNNGIGNTDITGFKSYSLMRVGLSTAGWLRIYADNASRTADISRSVGVDPAPGSGVIAEVVTTGISTTQIITPFVMGGNLNNPADATIYAAITNLSGSTQAITANLTILQLEA